MATLPRPHGLRWIAPLGGLCAAAAAAAVQIAAGPVTRAILAVVAGAVGWALLQLVTGRGGLVSWLQARRQPSTLAERDLPLDLDQPLAAFDPAALPDRARKPVPVLAPLAPRVVTTPGERTSTIDLPRVPAPGAPSVSELLQRLDAGPPSRFVAR